MKKKHIKPLARKKWFDKPFLDELGTDSYARCKPHEWERTVVHIPVMGGSVKYKEMSPLFLEKGTIIEITFNVCRICRQSKVVSLYKVRGPWQQFPNDPDLFGKEKPIEPPNKS